MAREPRTTRTEDDGAAHKYFAMIPHTITRGNRGRGLSLPARWLYVYLKSVTGEGGVCDKSTTTIVKEAQLGRGTIGPAKDELVRAGLITLVRREGKYHATDVIHLLDIWPENMQEFKNYGCTLPEQPPSCTLPEQPANCTRDEQLISSTNSTKSLSSCTPDEQSGCTPPVLGCTPPVPKKKDLKNKTQDKDLTPGREAHARTPDVSHITNFEAQAFSVAPSTRCPANFVPDPKIRPWAQEHYPSVNYDEALAAMMDYEFQRPRSDWNAALRTWIRREATDFNRRPLPRQYRAVSDNPLGLTDKEARTMKNIEAMMHDTEEDDNARRRKAPLLEGPR